MLVKTLGLSKLVYAASMVRVPEMVIKLGTRKNNKIFAKNKNDKIKDLLYINLCQTVDLTFAQWLNLYA